MRCRVGWHRWRFECVQHLAAPFSFRYHYTCTSCPARKAVVRRLNP